MQLGPAHRNAPYRPLRPRNEVPAVPGAHVVALETGQHPLLSVRLQRAGLKWLPWLQEARGRGARSHALSLVAPPPSPSPALPAALAAAAAALLGVCGAVAGAAEVRLGAETRGQCQAQAKKGWAVHSGCGAEAQHGRLGPHLPTAPASLGEQAPRTGGRAAQPPGEDLQRILLVPPAEVRNSSCNTLAPALLHSRILTP